MNFQTSTILFICCLTFACAKKESQVTPAFYHWKTQLQLSPIETSYIDSLHIKKLYVKFFDVDQSNSPEKTKAIAQLQSNRFNKQNFEIIPTVFITNRTLYQLDETELNKLAERIYIKIQTLRNGFDESPLTEIQIDCDWSLKTKDKYFTLLRFLRKQFESNNTQLSATIRLHQIKFLEKTGAPPIDRGMLMFYNMGEVTDINTNNSIIDLTVAEPYLSRFSDYPIELDMALPIFSWGVLFRDEKMIKLVNNLEADDLADTSRFYKALENQYKVIKSTYLQGYYLYEGDRIRLEQSSISTIKAAAKKLSKLNNTKQLTVSLYHLDTMTLKNYSYDQLQGVYDQFIED